MKTVTPKSVGLAIWEILKWIFYNPWKRTSFWFEVVYGLFMTTAVFTALWAAGGYFIGNLFGNPDPRVSLPMFPWFLTLIFPDVPMYYFGGDKIPAITWFVPLLIMIFIMMLSWFLYPEKGLSSGKVGRIQFIGFHGAFAFIVIWCFVQYEFPKFLFGIFG